MLPASLNALSDDLRRLQTQLKQRDAWVRKAYLGALLASVAFFIFVPFPVSRVGSCVLICGFILALGKYRNASRSLGQAAGSFPEAQAWLQAQLQLCGSVILYVPILAGANLFWFGLPGTQSVLQKAALDCVFLAGTVGAFAAVYFFNQQQLGSRLRRVWLRMQLQQAQGGDFSGSRERVAPVFSKSDTYAQGWLQPKKVS